MQLPRVIIDTNVIIAAQKSRHGASAKLVSLIGTGVFELHLSIPLALEYEEVLLRLKDMLNLTQTDVMDIVDALCTLSIHHKEIYYRWRPFLPDEKDDFILELAVKARCQYIITFNHKDFAGVERFGLQVINPKMFVSIQVRNRVFLW